MKEKHFLVIIVIMLGIITCLAFMSCNDGGTPSHTTVDSTKVEPVKVDTTKHSIMSLVNEAVSRMTYVFVTGPAIEMKEGDNSDYLQSLIDKKTGTYLLPNGHITISKTLKFVNSDVVLVGSGNTIIDVEPGQDAVEITGGGPTIAKIKFSSNPNIGQGTGIKLHAVAKLIEVWVHGFGGKGIAVVSDVEAAHTNASHSQILFCQASENGDDGLYFHDGDANACDVIGFDSRDNKGWGINDDSFLGNTFIGAMCHNNAKGHYRAENGGNRSAFFGCYAEQDSPPSRFGGVSRVYSGLHGWKVSVDKEGKYYYEGTNVKYEAGGHLITSNYAKVDTQ